MKLDDPDRTILVVDDDPDIRDAMCDALAAVGYCTVPAANGREALDRLCGDTRPCLILLDLMMPVMDGGEFLAVLRSTEVIATLPVVVVSAWPDLASRLREQTQGFVKKPVKLAALVETAASYCRPCREGGARHATS